MFNREFILKPSKYYFSFLMIIFFISMTVILTLPFSFVSKEILTIVMSIYLFSIIWSDSLFKHKNSIRSIHYQDNNQWQIKTNIASYTAQLCGDSTLSQFVMVLRFRPRNAWRIKSCMIFRDSLSTDDFRRLLVVAKFYN